MLYALVLVVTTTTTVQPASVTPDAYSAGAWRLTAPVVMSQTSQQVVGYFRTERGCLGASLTRSKAWPDFAPGQSVTGLCVQVEIPATQGNIEIVG